MSRKYQSILTSLEQLDNSALPDQYDTTRLTLLVRDPYCICAYWMISSTSIEWLLDQLDTEPLDAEQVAYVIRLYDVSYIQAGQNEVNHQFDVEIDQGDTRQYIHLWRDNVSYCGELGVKTQAGEFVALARSNLVTTPRACVIADVPIAWLDKSTSPNGIQAQSPSTLTPHPTESDKCLGMDNVLPLPVSTIDTEHEQIGDDSGDDGGLAEHHRTNMACEANAYPIMPPPPYDECHAPDRSHLDHIHFATALLPIEPIGSSAILLPAVYSLSDHSTDGVKHSGEPAS